MQRIGQTRTRCQVRFGAEPKFYRPMPRRTYATCSWSDGFVRSGVSDSQGSTNPWFASTDRLSYQAVNPCFPRTRIPQRTA